MSPVRVQLRALRDRRKWSQHDLANHAGVRQATISELEAGKARRVALDVLDRLAKALGVEPGQLLERTKR